MEEDPSLLPTIQSLHSDDVGNVIEMGIRAWTPVFPHIESSYGSDLYGLMVPDPVDVQRAAIADVCKQDDIKVFVAQNQVGIVGFLALRSAQGEQMAEIYMIAVDPGSQRRGTARQLIAFAEKFAQDKGHSLVMIETGADAGHAPARDLYSSCGYRHVEVARYFKILN